MEKIFDYLSTRPATRIILFVAAAVGFYEAFKDAKSAVKKGSA